MAPFVDFVARTALSQAMPNTFEKRARDALEAQDGSFQPRGEKNRALFEVLKKEMLQDFDGDVVRCKKRAKDASSEAMRRVETATAAAIQKIEALAEETVAIAMKKRKVADHGVSHF